jgi:purine-binding chemotaxis protein CheW
MTAENVLDQWVVLRVDGREFALPVHQVVEVLRMVAIQPLSETPPWIAGVLNLRGTGIAVLDLRQRLGLSAKAADLHSQIVIVNINETPLGLIADEVIDIITLPRSALKPADRLAGASPLFTALAHAGERLIFVLDLERLTGESRTTLSSGVTHV